MAGSVAIKFTAQTQEFRDQLNRAKADLKSFGASAADVKAVNAQLQQFSGARLIQQTEKMALGIRGIGGAAKLTDSELKSFSSKLDEYFQKADRVGAQIPAHMRDIRNEVSQTIAALSRADGAGGGFFSQLTAGLKTGVGGGALAGGLAGGIAGVVTQGLSDAINGIKSQIGELASEGAKLSRLEQPFQRLSGGAEQAEQKLSRLRVATLDMVADSTLMQASNKASLLGVDALGVRFDELARTAVVLGRAMGEEAGKSVDDLTTAIGRQSVQVADNLGLQVSLEIANQKYAASIGLTSDKLTDQQKKIAFATELMEKARAKVAELGDPKLTAADQWDRVTGIIERMGTAAFSAANKWQPLITALNHVVEGAKTLKQVAPLLLSGPSGSATASILGIGRGAEVSSDMARRAAQLQVSRNFDPSNPLGVVIPGMGADVIKAPTTGAGGSTGGTPPKKAGGTGTQFTQRAYDPLIDAIRKMPADLERAQDAANKRADDQFGKALKEAQKSQAAAVARMTQDAIRSAQTTTLTTLQSNLWGGSGLLPRSGAVSPLVSGLGGAGTTNGLIAPIGTWATTSVPSAPKPADVSKWDRVTDGITNLSSAIGTLGEISGGALDTLFRALGTSASAGQAGVSLVDSVGSLFGTNWLKNNSRLGSGIASALGGGIAGWNFGASAGSRTSAALGGAASGALSGLGAGAAVASLTAGGGAAAGAAAGSVVPIIGTLIGAAAGALMGYIAKRRAEAKAYDAKDKSMAQVEAEFGGLDNILGTLGRLGFSQAGQEDWLRRWFGDPKAYESATSQLTKELVKETQQAEKLEKAFERVSEARGMLSRDDFTAITRTGRGGPADASIGQFLQDQTSSLVGGLNTYIGSGKVQGAGVEAAGAGLGAAFTLMREQGMSTADILRELEPTITSFRTNIELLGRGSADSYVWMSDLMSVMNNADLQPFIDQASGAQQILTALQNTGMLSQTAFNGLAGSITESWKAIEGAGKGPQGLDLLAPQLQQVWQASEKFGYSLDEQTQGLIDLALESGKIGPAFLSSTDAMTNAINALIGRLDVFLDRLGSLGGITLPTIPDAPSLLASADVRQEINIDLDGRRIAETVARELPDILDVRA